MSLVFERPSLWQRLRPVLAVMDGPLLIGVALLCALGLQRAVHHRQHRPQALPERWALEDQTHRVSFGCGAAATVNAVDAVDAAAALRAAHSATGIGGLIGGPACPC